MEHQWADGNTTGERGGGGGGEGGEDGGRGGGGRGDLFGALHPQNPPKIC